MYMTHILPADAWEGMGAVQRMQGEEKFEVKVKALQNTRVSPVFFRAIFTDRILIRGLVIRKI